MASQGTGSSWSRERPLVTLISVSLRVVLTTHVYHDAAKARSLGSRVCTIFTSPHIGKRPSKAHARPHTVDPAVGCPGSGGPMRLLWIVWRAGQTPAWACHSGHGRVVAATEETAQEADRPCSFLCAQEGALCTFILKNSISVHS